LPFFPRFFPNALTSRSESITHRPNQDRQQRHHRSPNITADARDILDRLPPINGPGH
jgi:hypothetical protein